MMGFTGKGQVLRLAGCGERSIRSSAMLLAVALIMTLLSACGSSDSATGPTTDNPSLPRVTGSGRLVTKAVDLRDFIDVEVRGALRVEIVQSPTFGIELTSDDNTVDRIEVVTQGQTLRLGMKPGRYTNSTFKARVEMPDLHRVELSQASEATLAGFKSIEGVDIKLSGASKLTGRLGVDSARLTLKEASTANLGGTAGTLTLTAGGASVANMGDWSVDEAKVHMREGSTATANVKGKLGLDLQTGSTLYYVGNPTLDIGSISSGSMLKHR